MAQPAAAVAWLVLCSMAGLAAAAAPRHTAHGSLPQSPAALLDAAKPYVDLVVAHHRPIAVGLFAGLVVGWLLKKLLRTLAMAVGIVVLAVGGMAYLDWVTINWDLMSAHLKEAAGKLPAASSFLNGTWDAIESVMVAQPTLRTLFDLSQESEGTFAAVGAACGFLLALLLSG